MCDYKGCEEPALEDSEYCIYHKPDKNEEEAREFYEKIKKNAKAKREKLYLDTGKHTRYRWTEQCVWKGYVFPKPPKDLNGFFEYSVFDQGVFCSNAKFERTVHFNKSTFNNNVEFVNVNFMGGGMFGAVHFKGNVRFGGTIFDSTASFISAHFYKRAHFNNVHFGGNKVVNFGSTIFDGFTTFAGASFKNVGRFKKAVFNGDLSFSNSHFNHGVEGLSKREDTPRVSGLAEVFIKDSLTSDELSTIAKIGDHTYQKEIGLYGKKGENLLTNSGDKGKKEYKTEYATKVERREAIKDIEEHVVLDNVQGVKIWEFKGMPKFGSPEAQEVACRKQRISYENEGEKEKADQMFLREMRARRETRDSQFQRFIDWLVADWTCRYGTSWQRVLLRSGQFIFGFTFLYWYFSIISLTGVMRPYTGTLISNSESIVTQQVTSLFTGLGNSLYHSTITFTTIGYGDLNPSGLMTKIVSGIESAIGALFVALIIVVFARKWMRG